MTTQMQLAEQFSEPSQLIPVFDGTIGGIKTHVCKASDLHRFMEVATKFADWIVSRIKRFGFIAGQDFELISEKSEIKNLASEKSEAKRGGDRRSKDYHLSLDMAKELSMVENNDKGREARRYFIGMEKQAIALLQSQIMNSTVSRACISPEQKAALHAIVDRRSAGNRKIKAQMWSRHNKHFRVAEYKELLAIHFDDAVAYLEEMELTVPKTDAPKTAIVTLPTSAISFRQRIMLVIEDGKTTTKYIPDDACIIDPTRELEVLTLLNEYVPSELIPAVLNACAKRFANMLERLAIEKSIAKQRMGQQK